MNTWTTYVLYVHAIVQSVLSTSCSASRRPGRDDPRQSETSKVHLVLVIVVL